MKTETTPHGNDKDTQRKAFFNDRAATWMDRHYKNHETNAHDRYSDKIMKIVSTLRIEPNHQILDVGCGSGVLVPYIMEYLSPKGRLFEMDYAREMIVANQKRHTDERITFICSDVLEIPFEPGSLDIIICFACFPHFQDQKEALKRMSKRLKPKGRLTIAHLMSSEEIARHHNGESAVSRDTLPTKKEMEAHVKDAGLTITAFTDEPGNYLLSLEKGLSEMVCKQTSNTIVQQEMSSFQQIN